ncbi:NUDIX domain-containing protein [Reinekea forsetii]|nr:NUDIX domain-containing protein [Reinekea forsetii]
MQIVTWGDKKYKLAWVLPDDLPAEAFITTAHGYCFKGCDLLVVEKHRGFELPGGHLNPGEDYKAAFKREAFEEACVQIGEVVLHGFIRVEPLIENSLSDYPSVSFMAFCSTIVKEEEVYSPQFECISRKYIPLLDIRQVHHSWNDIYEPSLQSAVIYRSTHLVRMVR